MNERDVTELLGDLFPAAPVLQLVPLRGGLEASVARLTVGGERSRQQMVVKRLTSGARREALRYQLLASSNVTPRLIAAAERDDATYLFLEHVRPVSTWPWRDSANTRLVLRQLARVHRIGESMPHPDDWDYERELHASAAETLAVALESAPLLPELDWRREFRTLRRVSAGIAEWRHRMREVLGSTLIHGDVHSGNVILRRNGEVVLLDWGRSRAGSPLEDVSSWLLSLRSWEPAAERDHDTLFRDYLAAAGHEPRLTPELRDGYWIAAASNALAGALRYQLVVARDAGGRKREVALAQAQGALRVIRRADERMRSTR